MCRNGGTLDDTYLHVINATTQDTIDSDDGCGSDFKSKVVALGLPNARRHNPDEMADPARDSLWLVSGHDIHIVVEEYSDEGNFELTITGYKLRPSSIRVSGAPSDPVCIYSNPIRLDATTPGATAYQWLDAGSNPIPGATSTTYTIIPNTEMSTTYAVRVTFDDPNGDASCPPTVVYSSDISIVVEDTARAQIADASNNIASGQTLTIPECSDVTFNAYSTQTPENSYTWKRYNRIPPLNPPDAISPRSSLTINNIAAGAYTIILEAVRGAGACGKARDTVYLNVTSGLRADMGGFVIHPNPNTGTFTIRAPAAGRYQVQVLDVAGRLVATEAFEGSTYQMRLSLPAGVYQVRFIQGDKSSTQRLIITE